MTFCSGDSVSLGAGFAHVKCSLMKPNDGAGLSFRRPGIAAEGSSQPNFRSCFGQAGLRQKNINRRINGRSTRFRWRVEYSPVSGNDGAASGLLHSSRLRSFLQSSDWNNLLSRGAQLQQGFQCRGYRSRQLKIGNRSQLDRVPGGSLVSRFLQRLPDISSLEFGKVIVS